MVIDKEWEVWEEEHLENRKDDDQFDGNDRPQRFPQSHIPKSIVIEIEYPVNDPVLLHGCCLNAQI